VVHQNRRHVPALTGLEGVSENEREDGREGQEQNENAAVSINVEEFLVGHAGDGAESSAVHVDFKTAS
jgi:hypothetical protein